MLVQLSQHWITTSPGDLIRVLKVYIYTIDAET